MPPCLRGIHRILLPALSCLMLAACSLPPLTDRSESRALPEDQARQTRLGQALAPLQEQHPGRSGIHPLPDAHDAFAARALLARAAERTLDVQYYIWRGDTTGHLLLGELHQAAERGVRVRLLLDDGGTAGLDNELAALNQHPKVEVRLFNPFVQRTPKFLGYLTDFSRTQRRMHNKSFTADSQASIVGGRNIGDEYFAATDGVLFADLDVMAAGPVVQSIAQAFDLYWNSASAYPVDRLLPVLPDYAVAKAYQSLRFEIQRPRARDYVQAVTQSRFSTELLAGELPLHWAHATLVSDDPAKVLGQADEQGLLLTQLAPVIGQPLRELDLVSPYFVPTQAGVDALAALSRQGVKVRVLTNSLQATDVALVHAGYARYRKPLLEQGIALYELRRQPGATPDAPRASTSVKAMGSSGSGSSPGSSGTSLHAKTFAIDRQRVFVGSFNFDPRSALLNTEMGLVIESPALAAQMSEMLDHSLAHAAYALDLDTQGRLRWTSLAGQPPLPQTTDTEPGTHVLQRLMLHILGWLPIEGLL
ncbi:phospholipase D family protein [Comamonas composti]|uniref:phospholipase D family protein n=1 Tax=Comamonas composti TaxID=408558 RepID=UPI00040A943C|nr:phospholipase D family protein [Comamonas composti]